MRRSLSAWLMPALLSTSATMAASTSGDLPPALSAKARSAGSAIEAVEIVDGAGHGLFDRSGGRVLHVSREVLASATTSQERTVLLAVALSYKLGLTRPPRSRAADVGGVLASMAAANIDESIAGRDRADPYLELPTTPRQWERQRETRADERADPVALRGLAWARSSGVCEKITVALLARLGSTESTNRLLAMDARTALKGLGVLRFTPDEHCPA